ncbi:MAG: hypothetical protein QM214_01220 [Bacillota bacterium]|jgi:hypothetical protein|nr:hypothetical protein [Bacillota bacterium]HHU43970.1 hypothetical protein [Clostridiales bacterium]
MVFRIKKELFKDVDDFVIREGDFYFSVAKFIKSYAIYNKQGAQIAQVEFKELKAKIIIAESGTFTVVRQGDGYSIEKAYIEKNGVLDKDAKRQNKSVFSIFGKPTKYNYDIYEMSPTDKNPKVVANIIDDIDDNKYYKIRITGGSNILKLILISLAIAKLNIDPESRY